MVYLTPNKALSNFPVFSKLSKDFFKTFTGIENPMFSALLDTATFIPITSPHLLIRGPPELPGFIAASV